VSKLLERIVARQLNELLQLSDLLRRLQTGNLTETAVLSDLLETLDSGDIAALVLCQIESKSAEPFPLQLR